MEPVSAAGPRHKLGRGGTKASCGAGGKKNYRALKLSRINAVNHPAGEDSEYYEQAALTEWLPQANDFHDALLELARAYDEQHGDPWLAELLEFERAAGFRQASLLLAQAIRLNQSGIPEQAFAAARGAAEAFRRAGTAAGTLRAQTEEVYALAKSYRTGECTARAREVSRDATRRRFRWIAGQNSLQEAACYGLQGDEGRAILKFEESRRKIAADHYHVLELRATGLLIDSQSSAGSDSAVWKLAGGALRSYWNSGAPGIRAQQIYFNMSRAAERMGQNYSALAFMKAATDAIGGGSYNLIEAMGHADEGRLSAQTGDRPTARVEYSRSEQLFGGLDQTPAVRSARTGALILRARAEAESDPDGALKLLAPYVADTDRLPGFVTQMRFHETLGRIYLRLKRPAEALRFLGRSLDLISRRLASLQSPVEKTGALKQGDGVFRAMVEAEIEIEPHGIRAFDIWQWFRAGTPRSGPASLRIPERWRQDGSSAALVYVAAPSGPLLWTVADGQCRFYRLNAGPDELAGLIPRFTRECASPESREPDLRRDGTRLYDLLLAPAEEDLRGRRKIVIQADGALAGIPFQALRDGEGRYLLDRFAIEYASNLTAYRPAGPEPLTSSARALIVANPRLTGEGARQFPPLSESAREAALVAAAFQKPRVLNGNEATLPNFDRMRANAELIHFAGHGYSSSGNGALLLTPGPADAEGFSALTATQVARQDWRGCRLAVLSACSTGIGETAGPMNPASLVRAFLSAGARQVVASSWNVDAAATAELMAHFYQTLRRGVSPSGSLRLAASKLRADPARAHPYYWAGFQTYCCQ